MNLASRLGWQLSEDGLIRKDGLVFKVDELGESIDGLPAVLAVALDEPGIEGLIIAFEKAEQIFRHQFTPHYVPDWRALISRRRLQRPSAARSISLGAGRVFDPITRTII